MIMRGRVGTEPVVQYVVPGRLRGAPEGKLGVAELAGGVDPNLPSFSPLTVHAMGAPQRCVSGSNLGAIQLERSTCDLHSNPTALSSDSSPWLLPHSVGGFLGSP